MIGWLDDSILIESIGRNTVKLNEVTAEFDKRLSSCCDQMTKAWDEREKMMNGIVARIIHFQVGGRARFPRLFLLVCCAQHFVND